MDRIKLAPDQIANFHASFSSFCRLVLDAKLSWNELEDRQHEQGLAPVGGCLRIYRR